MLEAGGGKRLLSAPVAVHLIIGSFLTLLILESGKKGLEFDPTVIALRLAATLGYGVRTACVERQVYPVVDRLELVTAKDLGSPRVTCPEFERPGLGPATLPRRARASRRREEDEGDDDNAFGEGPADVAAVLRAKRGCGGDPLRWAEPVIRPLVLERETVERTLAHHGRAARSVHCPPPLPA